jgi:SAM-dependent methyltransferase
MLAAVPVSSQLLDLGCGEGRHTEPLLRLGFPVHACDPRSEAVEATRTRVEDLIGEGSVDTTVQVTPLDAIEYADATIDWVIADRAEIYVSNEDELRTLFEDVRRVLKPGGWLYLTLPAVPQQNTTGEGAESTGFSIDAVEACRTDADLAEAQEPTRLEEDRSSPRVRALYRRVDPHTPA